MKALLNSPIHIPFFILLFSLLPKIAEGVITGSVILTSSSINTATTYQFEVYLSSTISSGGSIVITFPSQVTLPSTVTCSPVYGFSGSSATCTKQSSTQIKLSGCFPNNDLFIIFQVSTLTNPYYVSTFYTQVTSYDSSSSQIETSGSTSIKFQTTAGTLALTLTSLSSTVVAAYTNLQLSILINNYVNTTGYVEIYWPKWNPGTQNIDNVESVFAYSSSDYSVSNAGYLIDCSSSAHASLKCVLIVSSPSSTSSISSSTDTLRLLGFSSTLASQSTLVVSITNSRFRNPYSTKPLTTITAKTFTSNGQNIDLVASGVTYTATSGTTLSSSYIQISPSNSIINEESQYDFTIYVPLPLPVGTVVYVTIPSQISLYDDSPYDTDLLLSSAIGYTPISPSLQVSVISSASTSQKIQINNFVPSSSYYVDEDQYVKFSLLLLKNPSSTASVDAFGFSFYDSDYLMMTGQTSDIEFDLVAGSLNSISVSLSNYRIREAVTYTFTFTTADSVPAEGQVQIQVPSEFLVSSSSLAITSVLALSSSTQAAYYNSNTRCIVIKSAFSSAIPASTEVSFEVTNGLNNPNTTQTTSSGFVLSTLDSSGNLIANGSTSSITATPNTINEVVIKAICNAQGTNATSEVCTYQLNVELGFAYPILVNSQITIKLPVEIGLNQMTNTQSLSYTNGINDRKALFSANSSGYINIKNAFYPNTTGQTQYIISNFSLYLANLTTPRTTETTSSFHIYIYDSSGYTQYKKEASIYGTVTNGQSFTEASLSRTSSINGDSSGIYNFSLTLATDCFKGEYIKIVPPSSVTINSGQYQCQGLQSLQSILACSVQAGSLYILLSPADLTKTTFTAGTTLIFTVANISNPLSLLPTTSFSIYIVTSNQNNYYVNQVTSGLSIQNQWPSNLTLIQVIPDSYQLGTLGGYNFYFTTTNVIPLNGSLSIYIPISIYGNLQSNSTNITCSSIKTISSNLRCHFNASSPNSLIITNGFSNTSISGGVQIGVRVNNIKNPATSVSDSERFIIQTLDTSLYTIDSSFNTISFSIGCVYPCESCLDDQSQCTACASNAVSSLNPFYLYENQCELSCPIGYFGNDQYQCQACSYPCQSCAISESECASCLSSSSLPYLYSDESICLNECPLTTYLAAASMSCEECVYPCDQCESADACLTCQDSYYFWSSQCFESCPNTTVPLETTDGITDVRECQDCRSPCLTCSITRDNCTSCIVGAKTYYYYENECLESCPKEYLPDENNNCVKQSETVYPFLSFIFTGSFLILIAISNKLYPRTRFFTSFLAIESLLMIPLWIYLLIFLLKDHYTSSSGIVIIALIFNTTINIFWYFYYRKKVVALDESYQLYMKHYPVSQKLILIVSIVFTFQFFRIQYCRLFNNKALCCVFQLKEKYYKKLNRYSLIQITFVFLPVIAANIYNLIYTWYGRQVFWIDIECIFTTVVLFVSHVIVIYRTEKLYGVDKYSQDGGIVPSTTLNTTPMMNNSRRRREGGVEGDRTVGGEYNDLFGPASEENENGTETGKNENYGQKMGESPEEKQQRKQALDRVISRIKGNKEAIEILGYSINNMINSKNNFEGNEGNGKDEYEVLDEGDVQNDKDYYRRSHQKGGQDGIGGDGGGGGPGDTMVSAELIVNHEHTSSVDLNQNQHHGGMIGARLYQSENKFKHKKVTGITKEQAKSPYYQLAQDSYRADDSSRLNADQFLNHDESSRYNQLMQDSAREDLTKTQIFNEMDFTSAPIDAKTTLKRNPELQSKFFQFQKELDEKYNDRVMMQQRNNSPYKNYKANLQHFASNSIPYKYINQQMPNQEGAQYFPEITEKEEQEILNQNEVVQKYEIASNNKHLDHQIMDEIRKDIGNSRRSNKNSKAEILAYVAQNQRMEKGIEEEKVKRDEEIIVIDELTKEKEEMLRMIEDAKLKRLEDLQFIQEAHFTSDEEDMGISPSSYDILNQRFNEIGDVQIYMNSMGDGGMSKNEQNEDMEGVENEDEEPPQLHTENSLRSQVFDKRKQGKVVPITYEEEKQMNEQQQYMSGDFGNKALSEMDNPKSKLTISKTKTERTGQLNLHRSPSFYNNNHDSQSNGGESSNGADDQNLENNNYYDEQYQEQNQDQDQDDEGLFAGSDINKEEFISMIQEESKAALDRMRKMNNNKDDKDFQTYSENFINSLNQDLRKDKLNTKRLIDYIKELDEKEKKEIARRKKNVSEGINERNSKRKQKKKIKKAKTKDDFNKYGPYFRYTPFEWAVIASKGKAPFNNEHVDLIANHAFGEKNMGYWSPSTHQKGLALYDGASPLSKTPTGLALASPVSRQVSSRGTGGMISTTALKRLISSEPYVGSSGRNNLMMGGAGGQDFRINQLSMEYDGQSDI